MTNKIITPIGQASYPTLFTPRLNEDNGKYYYSVDILFDKKTDLSPLKNIIDKVSKEKWGDKIPTFNHPNFKDGDAKRDKNGNEVLAYKGKIYITVKNTRKPGVVDAQTQPILNEEEIYGGCYIRASLNPFAYDHKMNKGVSLSLTNVQKVKDGEPFSGTPRIAAEDEFDVIDDEADNPDNYKSSNLLG